MKSKRSLTQKKQAPGASSSSMNPWSWIVSPRFTSILLIAALGLCAIHLLFRQERDAIQSPLEKLYPPEILYFLKQAGLTDVFHSGWVVVVFSLLFLNLFCVFLDQLPLVFQWLARRSPRPISMESVFPKKKGSA